MPSASHTLSELRAALDASESRYATLANRLPLKVFVKSLDGSYEFVNDLYAADLGLPAGQVLGKDDFSFFPRELADRYRADDRHVAALGRTIQTVEPYVSVGRTAWIRTTKSPVRGPDGVVRAVLGLFEDVTVEHELVIARDREHRMFRAVWDYSRDAKFIANATTGLLGDVNPAAERLTGRTRAELVGMHQSKLHPPRNNEPDDGGFRIAVAAPMAGIHTQVLRADGKVIPVEITSNAIMDVDGNRLVIAAFRDMSSQLEHERALAKLNWSLAARDRASSALFRASSERELMQAVCDTITADGGSPLAWIGWKEPDAARTVKPVAMAGSASSYAADIHISWDDNEFGQGPTGTAIRAGLSQVTNDVDAKLAFSPWRERAHAHHLAASMVVPLFLEGEVAGALNI